ncbi:MAG: SOS response-associated peptidase [Oscillatoriales cyanobacterium C42_A2020_001]|nr:SOS response-associated peptidase [Leptolyngbyaceae cyanobacterium C42_A2020_001]
MCGRYSQTHSASAIARAFQLSVVPDAPPRYNIAPTQLVGAVLQPRDQAARQFRVLRWGLVPSWAKDAAIGNRLINARAETVSEKRSFRSAFRYRRCLIVADGFYEWQRQAGTKQKQPYYFQLENHSLFGFAGLWEHWESPAGELLETCTILTTEANEVLRPIHDRMPVILHPDDYDTWLDPTLNTSAKLQPLLRPYPVDEMQAYPVSPLVNKADCDRPDCIEPLEVNSK